MYLKRVEIHGFKSFADKTVIEFIPGVNGIVGPNGCGKSNITDAIRWVLGEKSAKALRGDHMADVIFSGSEDRKALNLAEVTLVFDNEDRFLDYDANEVEMTRRLYRINNEAEYFLNRQPCRMKDITDLIMDTGLGRDSLSIISQNNINEFVAAKPIERRGLFEEAAGVAKYKQRKKESVNKLESTTNNLARVADIINELETQIGPLKRQKEKAETYLSLQKELSSVEISVLVKVIQSLSDELKAINEDIRQNEENKTANESTLLIKEKESEDLEKKMLDLDHQVNELQGELLTVMNRVNELETQHVERAANRQAVVASNVDDQKAKAAALKETLMDALNEYNDRVRRYQQVKEEKNALDKEIAQNDQDSAQAREKIERLNLTLHKKRDEHVALRDAIENKSGYSYGVRSILKASASLNGILGAVGDLLKANNGYEVALATTLGGSVQSIITQKEADAKEAIAFLRKNRAGRATFLPVETMKPRYLLEKQAIIAKESEGYLGLMSEFCHFDAKLKNVAEYLLGNVIVADDLDHATTIAHRLYNRYRVVTLKGDVINVGGSLTGGSVRHQNNAFMQKKELERLEKEMKDTEKAYHQARLTLTNLENAGRELAQSFMQKQMSIAKLEVVINTKRSELAAAKREYEDYAHQAADLDDLVSGKSENALLDSLNAAKQKRDEISETIQTKRSLRMRYVNDKAAIDASLKELREDNRRYVSVLNEKKIAKSKHESELQNYLLRLNDTYRMTFEHAQSLADPAIDLTLSQARVKDLRRQIATLGHVNIDAIEEYKKVSERYEMLTKNQAELKHAQETLLKAIDDMDRIMTDRFSKTFAAINQEFNHVFRTLFGGGHAALHYTEPDNILETGIDIEAHPPGKSAKLHSFSGGENALIALSCLFAIITVRTVPLCILDEVEAALDIANVERFAKYLKHFSEKTQFIVVTHREGTMAQCDLLYGATMQQKGVTKLVSVQLKEAQKMASA